MFVILYFSFKYLVLKSNCPPPLSKFIGPKEFFPKFFITKSIAPKPPESSISPVLK